MSLFGSRGVSCPSCGGTVEMEVGFSVNAARRPELRQAILDGRFQVQDCGHCDTSFRLEPEIGYVDESRGQWLLVRPAPARGDWRALEDEARALFARAYGAAAPPAARAIGAGLVPRVVFGWAALREKLVCRDAGLDDTTLELLKLLLVRDLPDTPLNPDSELRLATVRGDALDFAWIRFADEAMVESLQVPRALYDDIARAPADWRELRAGMGDACFVDLGRWIG